MVISHRERHKTERIGWLRAAVLRGQRRNRIHGEPRRGGRSIERHAQ